MMYIDELKGYKRIRFQHNTAAAAPVTVWAPANTGSRLAIVEISCSIRGNTDGIIQLVDNATGTANVLFEVAAKPSTQGPTKHFERYAIPELTSANNNIIKLYNPSGVDVFLVIHGYEVA